jgi:hypothetical protein
VSTIFTPDPAEFFIASYPRGRRCSHPGCATILSVYNESDRCSLHEAETGLRYSSYDHYVCDSCGEVQQTRGHGAATGPRTCKRCVSKRTERRLADNGGSVEAWKRETERQRDRYYRKRYGVSESEHKAGRQVAEQGRPVLP